MEAYLNSLEFALRMEMDGQQYYLEQAVLNSDNELKVIFELLAESEKEHADLLVKRMRDENFQLNDGSILKGMNTIFRNLAQFKPDEVRAAKQLDGYRLASGLEEKSLELYQGMLAEASDSKDKELFDFLVKQEKEHLILFEELVTLLTRPEEWVESAEFGIRVEY